jgi:hypothetical protein
LLFVSCRERGMMEPHQSSEDRLGQIQKVAEDLAVLGQKLHAWNPDASQSALLDKQYAADLVQLWTEVLGNTHVQKDYAIIPDDIAKPHWLEPATLASLSETISAMTRGVEIGPDPDAFDAWVRTLRWILVSVVEQARKPGFSNLQYESGQLIEDMDYIGWDLKNREDQRLTRLTARAQNAVIRTETAAEAASNAAGRTGEDVMSSFYTNLASTEVKAAEMFRCSTVVLAVVGGAAAAFFVFFPGLPPALDIAANGYGPLIQKTVFIASIFGLAGYFARQAHQHRSMANWAGTLAVQLRTFDAFLAGIDNAEVKNELRKAFAARVFGEHPAMKGEPSMAPSAAAMDTAVGWAAKLMPGSK